MCNLYGNTYVNYLIIFNTFGGLWVMPALAAQYIYRVNLLLNPSQMSIYLTII